MTTTQTAHAPSNLKLEILQLLVENSGQYFTAAQVAVKVNYLEQEVKILLDALVKEADAKPFPTIAHNDNGYVSLGLVERRVLRHIITDYLQTDKRRWFLADDIHTATGVTFNEAKTALRNLVKWGTLTNAMDSYRLRVSQ